MNSDDLMYPPPEDEMEWIRILAANRTVSVTDILIMAFNRGRLLNPLKHDGALDAFLSFLKNGENY